ncbi:hypothetical protein B0T24DRAFT_595086 [Lasiosphaeria ovina]|uniref:Uncharacterized protein n=1 Tax=Lasiosphaeria ovina TaxID=92902 RepID=A0AAE0K895_9PEZI|nr:hypothetical protein B0T24DRAFT_595086 [Lasiosphaeria ovina]
MGWKSWAANQLLMDFSHGKVRQAPPGRPSGSPSGRRQGLLDLEAELKRSWEAVLSGVLGIKLPWLDGYDTEYFYIIDLNREVLAMNHSIHWQLGNIPRQDHLWLRAIVDSIYLDKLTISLELCPDEYTASLALELPKRNKEVGYEFDVVTPKKTGIGEARTVFLKYVRPRCPSNTFAGIQLLAQVILSMDLATYIVNDYGEKAWVD